MSTEKKVPIGEIIVTVNLPVDSYDEEDGHPIVLANATPILGLDVDFPRTAEAERLPAALKVLKRVVELIEAGDVG